MDIITYVTENALILIPVLIIVGQIIKTVQFIPDKYIPLILLPFGVVGAMALGEWNVQSAIQGVLVTGAAVYGNQIYKQMSKQ
ncbi:MAG: phage holin family protein [Clostridia bacterium]|nr:phage holin family protein [Clostridia bacterium]